MKIKCVAYAVFLLFLAVILSCADMSYIKNELSGTAKPTGGIQGTVSPTKNYQVEHSKLRSTVLSLLDNQGYIYEENPSTSTIKTEPKPLSGQRESGIFGAEYSAKLFIKIVQSSVTYNALFNKQSNVTMGGQNLEFPEKENELRKNFFDALDKEFGINSSSNKKSKMEIVSSSRNPDVYKVQKRLTELGYEVGPIDGIMGDKTRKAIRNFQEGSGLVINGEIDDATINKLGI